MIVVKSIIALAVLLVGTAVVVAIDAKRALRGESPAIDNDEHD